jgi:predicted  nucleic acid-binding Zn-ribbon protein
MAGKKQLPPVRAVADDEKAEPETLSGAITRGTRLDELKAMRRVLAAHIDSENTLARDLAPLMRQTREISKEIEKLEAQEAEQAKDAEVQDGNISTAWRPEAI